MTRYLLTLLLAGLSTFLVAQEQCDNGVDDDGDGLIDLQDDDCVCDGTEVFFPTSLFPNPSFEDAICSPGASSVDCAEGWMQASAGTPDYIESCMKFSDVIPVPPCDIPSGNMCFGFIYSNITNLQVREYVGTCLTESLQQGTEYKLNIWVGFLDNNGGDDLFVSGPMDLVVYGNDSCSSMPIAGTRDLCPLQAPNGEDWYEIGRIPVSGNDEWIQYSLDFIAERSFNAVILGPPCEVQTDTANYYFLDNVVLAEVEAFSDDIITVQSQNVLTGELVLEVPDFPDVIYQWYKDDVAIVGETGTDIDLLPCEGQNGMYSVVVSNANGCTESVPYIVDYAIPNVQIQGPSGICPGSAESLSISGDYAQVVWSTLNVDQNMVPISQGGNYSVAVRTDLGCADTAETFILNYTEIDFTSNVVNESIPNAQDGSITLNLNEVLNNPTYTWSNNETGTFISNLNEGLYCVTITADDKCDSIACYLVGLDQIPFDFSVEPEDVSCNGGSDGRIEISVTGGTPPYSFQWSANAGGGSDSVVRNLEADIYSVTIVDDADFQRIAEIVVNEPDPMALNTIKQDVSCYNGSDGRIEILDITGGNGGNMIQWTPPSGNGMMIDNLAAGDYSVEVRDSKNCRIRQQWDVEQPDSMMYLLDTWDATCFEASDGQALISNIMGGSGNYIVTWFDGSEDNMLDMLTAGNYNFEIRDTEGCMLNGTATIGEPGPLRFDIETMDESCNGSVDGVLIVTNISGGTAPYTGLLDGVQLNAMMTRNDLRSGPMYNAVVQDANGCTELMPFTIGREFTSDVQLPDDTMVIRDSKVIIDAITSEIIDSYSWTSSLEGSLLCETCVKGELIVSDNLQLRLNTINEFGCTSQDQMNIMVRDPYGVYFPNAISPNDDGTNDFFRPFNTQVVRVVRSLSIYNRWGGLVHQRSMLSADDPGLWWNGRISGNLVNQEVYTYEAEVVFIDGTVIHYSGTLNTIR